MASISPNVIDMVDLRLPQMTSVDGCRSEDGVCDIDFFMIQISSEKSRKHIHPRMYSGSFVLPDPGCS